MEEVYNLSGGNPESPYAISPAMDALSKETNPHKHTDVVIRVSDPNKSVIASIDYTGEDEITHYQLTRTFEDTPELDKLVDFVDTWGGKSYSLMALEPGEVGEQEYIFSIFLTGSTTLGSDTEEGEELMDETLELLDPYYLDFLGDRLNASAKNVEPEDTIEAIEHLQNYDLDLRVTRELPATFNTAEFEIKSDGSTQLLASRRDLTGLDKSEAQSIERWVKEEFRDLESNERTVQVTPEAEYP